MTMPRIKINRDTLAHVKAFHALGEQLLGEPMTVEQCAEALLFMGMRAIVEGIWKPHDPDTLLMTLQKLAEAHPQQVYPFLVEVLKIGKQLAQERERDVPFFGFRSQPAAGHSGG
jgi:hypothetical protein